MVPLPVFDELRFAGGHFYQIPNIPAIPKAEVFHPYLAHAMSGICTDRFCVISQICREVKARLLM